MLLALDRGREPQLAHINPYILGCSDCYGGLIPLTKYQLPDTLIISAFLLPWQLGRLLQVKQARNKAVIYIIKASFTS